MVWEAVTARKYDAERAAFSTFVYAVANMVWLRHLRAVGRAALNGHAGELREAEAVIGSGEPDPAAALAAAQEVDAVRAAMNRREGDEALSDEERVILCGLAQGESDRGLAAELRLAPSTVNIKKHRALEKLRRALEARGAGSAAEASSSAAGAARSGDHS